MRTDCSTPRTRHAAIAPTAMNAKAAKVAKGAAVAAVDGRPAQPADTHRRTRARERMAVRLRAFVPGPESACVRRFATPSTAATAAPTIGDSRGYVCGQLCGLSGLCV